MKCTYDFSYTNETDRADLEKISEKEYLQQRSPGFELIKDAVVLPAYTSGSVTCGGVLDSKGRYVEYSRDSVFTDDDFHTYLEKHFPEYKNFFNELFSSGSSEEDDEKNFKNNFKSSFKNNFEKINSEGTNPEKRNLEKRNSEKTNFDKTNSFKKNKITETSNTCSISSEKKPVRIHEKAVYLGEYKGHWGHFLTSVVRRLWYVINNPGEKFRLVWLGGDYIFHKDKITGNFLRFFELAGIDEKAFLMPGEPVIFDELIVPEPCVSQGDFYLPEYRKLFEIVKKRAKPGKNVYEKVYLGRAGNPGLESCDFGEKSIAAAFADNGYHIAEPSGLTLDEQIWLISHAKTLACISGTLTHNLLFAQDGTELIVLNRQGYPMLSHSLQGMINEMKEARVTHVDVSLRLLPVNGAGPNIFFVTDELVRFFRDRKSTHIPEVLHGHTGRRLLVLAWYFFKWLDSYGAASEFRTARLEGQMDRRSIEIYTHFRRKMKWYDSSSGRRIRKLFYRYVTKHGLF